MNSTNNTEGDTFWMFCRINSNVYPLIKRFPSSLEFTIHLIACILSGIISFTTIALNLLTAVTIRCSPGLRKNILFYLISVLSFVDTGTGLFCYPTLTLTLVSELRQEPNCWIRLIQSKIFRLTSVLSLSIVTAISIERYFGVIHPVVHRARVTKVKLLQLLLFVWFTCAIVALLTFCTRYPLQYFTTISVGLMMLITVYAYIKIAFAIIQSERRRERLTHEVPKSDEQQNEIGRNENRKEKLHILKELKMAKSSFLIAICYMACYSPTLIFIGALRENLPSSVYLYSCSWCLLVFMSNSIFNSIIFFWRCKKLRTETKNFLKKMKMRLGK